MRVEGVCKVALGKVCGVRCLKRLRRRFTKEVVPTDVRSGYFWNPGPGRSFLEGTWKLQLLPSLPFAPFVAFHQLLETIKALVSVLVSSTSPLTHQLGQIGNVLSPQIGWPRAGCALRQPSGFLVTEHTEVGRKAQQVRRPTWSPHTDGGRLSSEDNSLPFLIQKFIISVIT